MTTRTRIEAPFTSPDHHRLPGIDAAALQRTLLDKHHVLVQAVAGQPRAPHSRGIRISPNVYTSVAELDRFATAFAAMVRH